MTDDRDSGPQGRMPGRPEPPRPPPRRQDAEPGRSVSVDITPRQLRVVPGQSETAQVSVRYHGTVITELTLALSGDATGWTRIAPDVLNLYPDTEAQATLLFDPPRASATRAGLTELSLQVYSSTDPTASTVLKRSIEVAAFDELVAEAVGSTTLSDAREAALPIKIRNRGNRPVQVTVRTTAMGAIDLMLSSESLYLDPGGEATVWLNVTARRAATAGEQKVHPFTVVVSSDRSPPVTIDGRLEQAGRQARAAGGRRWLLALVGAGALAVVGGVALVASGALNQRPTDTLSPVQTTPVGPSTSDTAVVSSPPVTATSPSDTGTPIGPTPPPTETPTLEPTPSPYTPLGWELVDPGPFTEVPAAASWEAGRVDIIAPRVNGVTFHAAFLNGVVARAEDLDTLLTPHKMAAVSSERGRIDAFAVERDFGGLWQKTFDPVQGAWLAWQLVDDTFKLSAGPGVASWGPGRLDVFARGPAPDGLLMHDWFDGFWNGWDDPAWSTTKSQRAPAAVAWVNPDGVTHHIEVFANSSNNGPLVQQTYDDAFGHGLDWQPLLDTPQDTLKFNTAPAAVSSGPFQIQLFAVATDQKLYQKVFNNSWTNWTLVSPFLLDSGVSAVISGPGRVDLFMLGPDGAIYHRWSQDGIWFPAG